MHAVVSCLLGRMAGLGKGPVPSVTPLANPSFCLEGTGAWPAIVWGHSILLACHPEKTDHIKMTPRPFLLLVPGAPAVP